MQSIPFSELTPWTGQIQYYCITPQHFSQPGTAYFRFFWQFAFLMQKQHPRISFSCRGSTSYFFTPAERLIVTFKFFIVGFLSLCLFLSGCLFIKESVFFASYALCRLLSAQTVSTVVSVSKGSYFTSSPSTGTGKLNTIFFIQLPSFLFSGNISIRSIKAFINSFCSASVAEW